MSLYFEYFITNLIYRIFLEALFYCSILAHNVNFKIFTTTPFLKFRLKYIPIRSFNLNNATLSQSPLVQNHHIIRRQMIPDWIFRRLVVWIFFIFRVVSDDKTPNRTSNPPRSLLVSSPAHSIFSRGFKFLFYAARFYCCYTIEKICGFQFRNEWMIKDFPSLLNVYEKGENMWREHFSLIVDEALDKRQ